MALCAVSAPVCSFLRFGSVVGITKGGEKKTLTYEDDQNLFEVLTNGGIISKAGTCMGNMSCGKCKIKVVSGKVPAPEDEEKELVGNSARLACAITCDAGINGAVFQAL